MKSYFPHILTPGVSFFLLLLVLLGGQIRGFSVSKFSRSRLCCGSDFSVAHCCSPVTVEWRRVWSSHTIPPSFKPDVLVRRLGKSGSSQAAHLAHFVLTVAQKPSSTAASRRPPAQWELATAGRHHRATLQRLHLDPRFPTCHVLYGSWPTSWWDTDRWCSAL